MELGIGWGSRKHRTGRSATGPVVLAQPVFYGVLFGLLKGKPLGITLFCWIAVRFGIAEFPPGVRWAHLHAVSWLGGIGFTVSIFIADLAFPAQQQYTNIPSAESPSLPLPSLQPVSAQVCWRQSGRKLVRRTFGSPDDFARISVPYLPATRPSSARVCK